MSRLVIAAALAATLPLAAQARCLNSADLDRGILVQFVSGDQTEMRRLSNGAVEVVEHYSNGDPSIRFLSAHGVYFYEEVDLDEAGSAIPGSRLVIEFPVDPLTLPAPIAGTAWEGSTVNVFADGTRRDEITSLTFSPGPDLVLPTCTYEVITSDVWYDWGDAGMLTLQYYYLPALGTAVLQYNQFSGEEAAVNEVSNIVPRAK